MIKSNLTSELWIDTADGRVFAKTWNFDGDCEAGNEPVILFHDSLGCVELWRDFPVKLARETGRAIIAYDRLGFGRSDKHPGRLGLNFVRDEARGSFAALRSHLGIKDFIAFGHSGRWRDGDRGRGCLFKPLAALSSPSPLRSLSKTERSKAFEKRSADFGSMAKWSVYDAITATRPNGFSVLGLRRGFLKISHPGSWMRTCEMYTAPFWCFMAIMMNMDPSSTLGALSLSHTVQPF